MYDDTHQINIDPPSGEGTRRREILSLFIYFDILIKVVQITYDFLNPVILSHLRLLYICTKHSGNLF
jgi:hypothetical protein